MKADTNFEGGNASLLRVTGENTVRFAAPKDTSPRSLWFHFRISSAKGKRITCEWIHTNEVLGGAGVRLAVPVYRSGKTGVWRRVDLKSCSFDRDGNRFTFEVPCRSDEVFVAHCYPYGPTELNEFVERMRNDPRVRIETLAISRGGRKSPLLHLSGGNTSSREKEFWIAARHHAGEVSGSYVLEGITEELLRSRLLDRLNVHIAPMMDIDNVCLGRYGKDSKPRDYNRDYCLYPRRPEVAALIRSAGKWSRGRVDFYWDLHAPAPGDVSFVVPVKRSLLSDREWRRTWAFASALEKLAPAGCPVRVADYRVSSMNWSDRDYDMTSTAFFHRCFGAMALTLETSYHRNYRGKLLTPDGWRALGRAMVRALEKFIAGKARCPRNYPDPCLPVLKRWLLVHIPKGVRLRETKSALRIESLGEESYLFAASPLISGTGGKDISLAYRLDGSVSECEATAKGVCAETGLPTGRFASKRVRLRKSRAWKTIFVPVAAGDGAHRVLVRLKGLRGALDLST